MIDVNNFDQLRIGLATADSIRETRTPPDPGRPSRTQAGPPAPVVHPNPRKLVQPWFWGSRSP